MRRFASRKSACRRALPQSIDGPDRQRSSRRSDYGAFAHRIQARRWHDPQAWHLRIGRTATRRISSSAFRSDSKLYNHPRFIHWHATRIWQKPSPSLSEARSKPISSCSPCLRSTKSSSVLSTAICRHVWCLTSRGPKRRTSARRKISISQPRMQVPQEFCEARCVFDWECVQVCHKCAVPFDPMCAKALLFNTRANCFRAGLIVGKSLNRNGDKTWKAPSDSPTLNQ
jgi:hypothetical protein